MISCGARPVAAQPSDILTALGGPARPSITSLESMRWIESAPWVRGHNVVRPGLPSEASSSSRVFSPLTGSSYSTWASFMHNVFGALRYCHLLTALISLLAMIEVVYPRLSCPASGHLQMPSRLHRSSAARVTWLLSSRGAFVTKARDGPCIVVGSTSRDAWLRISTFTVPTCRQAGLEFQRMREEMDI